MALREASAAQLISELRRHGRERNRKGMERLGIQTDKALGVSVWDIRKIGKGVAKDHRLAADLWASGIHEARILASLVDEPAKLTESQLEAWVKDFDSWDLCDQVCGNLFDKTPFAWEKARVWAKRDGEFVRRAGFALMAYLAWHRREANDRHFLVFLDDIEGAADDDRNFVKKAVSWALRQIGKRSPGLRRSAVARAKRIARRDSKTAKWIAKDALKELERSPEN